MLILDQFLVLAHLCHQDVVVVLVVFVVVVVVVVVEAVARTSNHLGLSLHSHPPCGSLWLWSQFVVPSKGAAWWLVTENEETVLDTQTVLPLDHNGRIESGKDEAKTARMMMMRRTRRRNSGANSGASVCGGRQGFCLLRLFILLESWCRNRPKRSAQGKDAFHTMTFVIPMDLFLFLSLLLVLDCSRFRITFSRAERRSQSLHMSPNQDARGRCATNTNGGILVRGSLALEIK